MIVEYLRYSVPEEQRTHFEKDYSAAIEPLMSSDYAISMDVSRCLEDPTQYILRIEWTSAEDHMQKFRGSEPFREFFSFIKPYLPMIDEMRHYERIAQS